MDAFFSSISLVDRLSYAALSSAHRCTQACAKLALFSCVGSNVTQFRTFGRNTLLQGCVTSAPVRSAFFCEGSEQSSIYRYCLGNFGGVTLHSSLAALPRCASVSGTGWTPQYVQTLNDSPYNATRSVLPGDNCSYRGIRCLESQRGVRPFHLRMPGHVAALRPWTPWMASCTSRVRMAPDAYTQMPSPQIPFADAVGENSPPEDPGVSAVLPVGWLGVSHAISAGQRVASSHAT